MEKREIKTRKVYRLFRLSAEGPVGEVHLLRLVNPDSHFETYFDDFDSEDKAIEAIKRAGEVNYYALMGQSLVILPIVSIS